MAITLLPILLAGGAVAQVMTAFPNINNAAIVAAVNPDDPGYQVCIEVGDALSACTTSLGGPQALATVAPSDIAACICCDGKTATADSFSSCYDYLTAEASGLASEAGAFSTLYSICDSNPSVCNGNKNGGGGGGGASPTPKPTPTKYSLTASGADSVSSITPSASLDDSACDTMIEYFSSCEDATPGFASLGYSSQASCYCCYTYHGEKMSTNGLDTQASSCAAWAKDGEATTGTSPGQTYSVASLYANFCSKFSDACSGTDQVQTPTGSGILGGPSATPTGAGDSTADSNGDSPSSTDPSPTPTPTDGAGAALRVGGAAGVVAIAALAIML